MNLGLDLPNSQKDPNFMQCQLIIVYIWLLTKEYSDIESYVAQITYIPKSV